MSVYLGEETFEPEAKSHENECKHTINHLSLSSFPFAYLYILTLFRHWFEKRFIAWPFKVHYNNCGSPSLRQSISVSEN